MNQMEKRVERKNSPKKEIKMCKWKQSSQIKWSNNCLARFLPQHKIRYFHEPIRRTFRQVEVILVTCQVAWHRHHS